MDLHAETSHLCDEFQNLIDSNRISESIFALEHKATVILNLLAVAYSSRLKDQIKSKKCLELLLEIDPTNVSGCSNLSHITNISGFFEEALKYSERSIVYSKGASYEGFYNRGVILLALGRTKEATAMFEKALELDPKNPSANYNIGLSLLKSEICQRG